MRNAHLVISLDHHLQNSTKDKNVAVLTHWGGDADSVGAAFLLLRLLREQYGVKKTQFAVPDTPTAHASAILNHLGLEITGVSDADVYILVDVGSLEQLGEFLPLVSSSSSPVILLDHHMPQRHPLPQIAAFCSDEYQATCEMVYDLANHVGWDFDRKDAEAVFLALYFDTARLSVADNVTMTKFCELLRHDFNPGELLSKLETFMDFSERVARLKAARRASIFRVGEWLVGTSLVSAFQTSAARGLLSLGVQVAFVAGQDGEMTRLSLRAHPDFYRKTSISMGATLSRSICEKFGGSGGGHASVARVRCPGQPEDVLRYAVRDLASHLHARLEEVT